MCSESAYIQNGIVLMQTFSVVTDIMIDNKDIGAQKEWGRGNNNACLIILK